MSHPRVVVVGAGIAGLAVAEALRRPSPGYRAPEVIVIERGGRPGGHIVTESVNGYLCEAGPNGFLDRAPATLDLVKAVGLADRLLPCNEAARRRFIYHAGRLHQVPGSPMEFFRSGLLSWRGKVRVLGEPFAVSRPPGDESIRDFATRRIGEEAAHVLVDSMVSGILAGDPGQLSLRASFPRMWELETRHGSLFRALLSIRRAHRPATGDALGAPAGRLCSFRGGMIDLVNALAARLGPALQMNRQVRCVITGSDAGSSRRFRLLTADGGDSLDADALVLAGPAAQSGALVRSIDPELAGDLESIATASVSVVSLGCREAVAGRPLSGFGLLVPRGEGPRLLGVLWESSIFEQRAPTGRVLLRAIVGGTRDPDAINLTDDQLVETVDRDLRQTMKFEVPERLDVLRIHRHRSGIPQYEIGHLDRLARMERRLAKHPGLFLAGSSYRGVALNACIADAIPLAAGIRASLEGAATNAAQERADGDREPALAARTGVT